jgi:NAD+ diphosphatase
MEQIEEWIEVEPSALGDVADRLEGVTNEHSDEIGGNWSDWGRFRAIVHRAVNEELTA